MIGDATLTDYAYNKYPLYPVGPGNLSQRFLMHGFFTEHLHARLEKLRTGGGLALQDQRRFSGVAQSHAQDSGKGGGDLSHVDEAEIAPRGDSGTRNEK